MPQFGWEVGGAGGGGVVVEQRGVEWRRRRRPRQLHRFVEMKRREGGRE